MIVVNMAGEKKQRLANELVQLVLDDIEKEYGENINVLSLEITINNNIGEAMGSILVSAEAERKE